jgi:hypothetical protein
MAISYAVNSQAISGGIQARWEPLPTGQTDNGATTYTTAADWARHYWDVDEMSMADWLVLDALRGVSLTNVTTTDYDNYNSGKTYTTARLVTVSGRQRGIVMQAVRVEFLIGGL